MSISFTKRVEFLRNKLILVTIKYVFYNNIIKLLFLCYNPNNFIYNNNNFYLS